MTGIIRRINSRRGFGFLQPLIGRPDTTPDLFFHYASIVDGIPPAIGSEVEFDVARGNNGRPQAVNIRVRLISLPAGRAERPSAIGRPYSECAGLALEQPYAEVPLDPELELVEAVARAARVIAAGCRLRFGGDREMLRPVLSTIVPLLAQLQDILAGDRVMDADIRATIVRCNEASEAMLYSMRTGRIA